MNVKWQWATLGGYDFDVQRLRQLAKWLAVAAIVFWALSLAWIVLVKVLGVGTGDMQVGPLGFVFGAVLIPPFLSLAVSVSLVAYMMPAVVAYARHHPSTVAVGMLNVLGGWFLLGWILSLVWAVFSDTQQSAQAIFDGNRG